MKSERLFIIVTYHGSGTKIKTASGQMTTKLRNKAKELGVDDYFRLPYHDL